MANTTIKIWDRGSKTFKTLKLIDNGDSTYSLPFDASGITVPAPPGVGEENDAPAPSGDGSLVAISKAIRDAIGLQIDGGLESYDETGSAISILKGIMSHTQLMNALLNKPSTDQSGKVVARESLIYSGGQAPGNVTIIDIPAPLASGRLFSLMMRQTAATGLYMVEAAPLYKQTDDSFLPGGYELIVEEIMPGTAAFDHVGDLRFTNGITVGDGIRLRVTIAETPTATTLHFLFVQRDELTEAVVDNLRGANQLLFEANAHTPFQNYQSNTNDAFSAGSIITGNIPLGKPNALFYGRLNSVTPVRISLLEGNNNQNIWSTVESEFLEAGTSDFRLSGNMFGQAYRIEVSQAVTGFNMVTAFSA